MKIYLKTIILLSLVLSFFAVSSVQAEESGKYRVVPGTNDNAYLVDTQTGAVWVLTQRTVATGTGREPIAIPYKFLYIRPDENFYLDEDGRKIPVGGSKKPR
jgi:hypothetical protein